MGLGLVAKAVGVGFGIKCTALWQLCLLDLECLRHGHRDAGGLWASLEGTRGFSSELHDRREHKGCEVLPQDTTWILFIQPGPQSILRLLSQVGQTWKENQQKAWLWALP